MYPTSIPKRNSPLAARENYIVPKVSNWIHLLLKKEISTTLNRSKKNGKITDLFYLCALK
jgi:hypothetical protein